MPETAVDISTAPVAEPDSGPTDFQVWGQEGSAVDAPVRQFPVGSFAVQSQIVTLQGQIDALDNAAASQAAVIADLTTQIGALEAIINNGGVAPTPVNLTAPSISDPAIGVTCVATPGTYEGTPTLSGQWYLADVVIPGATSASYTPSTGEGSELKYVESATFGGTATVTSSTAKVIGPALSAPSFTTAPSVTPSTGYADSLFTANYVLAGNPAPSATFRWFVNGNLVAGATGSTYVPPADGSLVTNSIYVEVTGTNSVGPVTEDNSATPATFYGGPTALNTLADVNYTTGTGVQTVDASGDFSGEGLVFSLSSGGAYASIDPDTGIVSIPTVSVLTNYSIVVVATNPVDSVSSGFSANITSALGDVLTGGSFATSATPPNYSLTAAVAGDLYWTITSVAANDTAPVIAGTGLLAAGPQAVVPGEVVVDIDISSLVPGSYVLNVVLVDGGGTPSNLRTNGFTRPVVGVEAWGLTLTPGINEITVTETGTPPTVTLTPGDNEITVSWTGGMALDVLTRTGGSADPFAEVATSVASPYTITGVTAGAPGLDVRVATPDQNAVATSAAAPFFTVADALGAYFVDPSNVPADTQRIEWEGKFRLTALPNAGGNILPFTQESTGADVGIYADGTGTSWTWSARVEDGNGNVCHTSTIASTGLPTPGQWFTVRVDMDMRVGFEHIILEVDGNTIVTAPFTASPVSRQFQTAREIAFLATTSGGSRIADDGCGPVDVEYLRAYFTTGGTRSLRKEIAGNAATVNADPWKLGGDAT